MHRLVVILVVVPSLALAGVLVPQEPGAKPLALRKESIRVEVKDQVARATLDEVFENATDRPLEATYLLPLPEGAAVSGFATWVGGQRVESRIHEKKDAEQTYAKAQAEHKAPAMLEQDDVSTFKTRVDAIPAHGTQRLEASFAQVLPYDAGLVTLRVPLVTRSASGDETVGEFSADLHIDDSKPIVELKSLGLPAKIERTGPNSFHVTLAGKDVALKDELALAYRTQGSRLGLSFVAHKPSGAGDGYFLLLASPQELTAANDIVHKDIVFVFDTSGSMHEEDKIGQARRALQKCLAALNPEDRFGVVAFSDSINPYKSALVPATGANLQGAIEFAQGLSADGSTNISGALDAALKMFEASDRPRVIVFMTDGQPTFGITRLDEISARVKAKNEGHARLFAFGVGSDVNRTFLEQLGHDNRGGVDFIDPSGAGIDTVVAGFYAKISKPVLSDVSLDFGDVTTAMQYPDVQPDLYKGSQLVMVGRYRGNGLAKAALIGTLNGTQHRIPFEAKFPAEEEDNAFVARLWAQRRIDSLLAHNRLQGESEEAKSEIIALSEQFQILTPYTSMVAVRPDAVVASISPARVKPGDPLISVRAPRSAKSVRVRLAWGEEKAARWDDEANAWTARFLIPTQTRDGSYPVGVDVELADGARTHYALEIQVDTVAPAIAVTAPAVKAGQPAALSAAATISPSEIAEAVLTRADPLVALKSVFDVRRVTARLWDGREVDLKLVGRGFFAEVETPATMAPGRYPVVFTALDFAGNESRVESVVEVLP